MDCNRFSQCKMLSFTEIISFKTVISMNIQHIWFHVKKSAKFLLVLAHSSTLCSQNSPI